MNWKEIVGIFIGSIMLTAALALTAWGVYTALTSPPVSHSLTLEKEAYLRERIEYLTAQVQLERLRCVQERAVRDVEDFARMFGLEVWYGGNSQPPLPH